MKCLYCSKPCDGDLMMWKSRSEKLWMILDNINALYDICKNASDATLLVGIKGQLERAYNIADSSDGYNLNWKHVSIEELEEL